MFYLNHNFETIGARCKWLTKFDPQLYLGNLIFRYFLVWGMKYKKSFIFKFRLQLLCCLYEPWEQNKVIKSKGTEGKLSTNRKCCVCSKSKKRSLEVEQVWKTFYSKTRMVIHSLGRNFWQKNEYEFYPDYDYQARASEKTNFFKMCGEKKVIVFRYVYAPERLRRFLKS